jgi:glutamate-1-semialdehyde aminotransferase
MEVQRNFNSENNFLQKVRNLCTKKNIILIFDECTSGFRESLGGIHLNHKVNPDMMILGKALGNGYPITAVLGKKKFMKCANKTFISSTFWTENLGYVAALETLKYMEKNKTYLKLKKTGKYIKFQWKKIALKHNLEIKVTGIDAIPSFNFIGDFNQKAITYITQEMLKNNILATNVIYISIAHKKNYVDRYLKQFDMILGRISELKNKNNLSKLIKGKERQSQLQRYN